MYYCFGWTTTMTMVPMPFFYFIGRIISQTMSGKRKINACCSNTVRIRCSDGFLIFNVCAMPTHVVMSNCVYWLFAGVNAIRCCGGLWLSIPPGNLREYRDRLKVFFLRSFVAVMHFGCAEEMERTWNPIFFFFRYCTSAEFAIWACLLAKPFSR